MRRACTAEMRYFAGKLAATVSKRGSGFRSRTRNISRMPGLAAGAQRATGSGWHRSGVPLAAKAKLCLRHGMQGQATPDPETG